MDNNNFFLRSSADRNITQYPIKPYKGVGMPNVLATAPEITASQLTTLFMLQG